MKTLRIAQLLKICCTVLSISLGASLLLCVLEEWSAPRHRCCCGGGGGRRVRAHRYFALTRVQSLLLQPFVSLPFFLLSLYLSLSSLFSSCSLSLSIYIYLKIYLSFNVLLILDNKTFFSSGSFFSLPLSSLAH